MQRLTHDLFLLMVSLSQIDDSDAVIRLFVDSLNAGDPGYDYRYVTDPVSGPGVIPVRTNRTCFGAVCVAPSFGQRPSDEQAVVINAVQMLALILEERQHRRLLERQNERLEQVVAERTASLRQTVAKLEREVIQRAEAENQLRQSEARYRRLVETCGEGVWEIDEHSCTTYVNRRMAEMLGYTPEQMMGQHLFTFMSESERAQAAANVQRRQSGIAEQHEFVFQHNDGHPVYTLINTAPVFTEDGRYAGALALISDISALHEALAMQKAAEQRLEQTQRLESLGVLAGGVAHDFNNLLTIILGNNALIRCALPEHHALQSHVQEIHQAGERAAELCKQLLAYAGAGRMTEARVALRPLIEQTLDLLTRAAPPGVVLQAEYLLEELTVTGDPNHIKQALINVVANAFEACSECGGTVTVKLCSHHLTAEQLSQCTYAEGATPGEYALIEVADTGPGISPETATRVFEPFFSTRFQGRGLGLSATLGIMRSHHGAICLRSTLGQGVTVRLMLPLYRPEPVRSADVTDTSQAILVIDDEPQVLKTTRRMLETFGYRVLTADSGNEGLRLAGEHLDEIGLVLLDMRMPGMSGDVTLQRLQDLAPQLPVIIISGYPLTDVMRHIHSLTPYGYLQKPFSMSDLRECVRRTLTAK